ncbi:catenin-like protein 1 [Seminavis robusta]|uniref:Catenin-like protein 1 n=1 Tax=Seminavis robusta TaxID=568900 RepID=A0A9N8DWA3_9STRA|nr:catenin-like protein 1 [Seminavis robusta]|eukprot:Sro328_g118550.1 catenin-like protein 1 (699) ;mRNA; r:8238-10334
MVSSSSVKAKKAGVSGDDLVSFIPAKTWQGSKPGYFFGTVKKTGLGYHLDPHQQKEQTTSSATKAANNKHKMVSPVDLPSAKRAKRSVVFAEDQNTVRTIPSKNNSNNSTLLEEAEQAAKENHTKVIDLTSKGVQNAIKNLQKANEKNQIQRSQHPDEPELYMDSEVALYEAIAALQPIAADPTNLYPPLTNNKSNDTLWSDTFTQLCMHPNADVVSTLVALLLELLDPALLDTTLSSQHARNQPVLCLAKLTLQHLMELIVGNLKRLQQTTEKQEAQEGIGKGVQDVLSLMENLLEMDLTLQTTNDNDNPTFLVDSDDHSVAAKLVKETPFLSWLFLQIQDNTPSKDRALEILAFLVQREEVHTIHPNWTQLPAYKSALEEEEEEDNNNDQTEKQNDKTIDGMEILLVNGIAPFRKQQPANETEVEALENAVICIEAALTFSPPNVQAFLDAQGIELVLRCLKEKVHAGGVALKLLDFSGSHAVYQKAAEHLVAQANGLKYFFPLYMGRQLPKPAILSWAKKNNDNTNNKKKSAITKAKKEWLHAMDNQTIRILYALTRHLTDKSPQDAKQRLLAKFLDDDKCDRLVELLLSYDQKERLAEFKFWKSDVEEELDDALAKDAALEAKLRGGGDIFHRLGAIAGFCCVGSKRCHERILSQLSMKQSGIAVVKAALEEFISVLGTGNPQAEQLQVYYDGI